MTTQQGLRLGMALTLAEWPTGMTYNGALSRLFDYEGIPAGTFNERQLRFINGRMGESYTNLNQAMQAFAESKGAFNWSSLGTLDT